MDLNDITNISAIARDVAFVVVCIVVTVAILVILLGVRGATRRFNEAMDRVDDLLDSVVSARDSLVEFKDRIRKGSGGGNSNRAFTLLTPIGYLLRQLLKRRSQDDETTSR